MGTARRKIAEIKTYNPSIVQGFRYEAVEVGYKLTMYADGSVAVERRSRWQGSRDGCRWRTAAGYVDPPFSDAENVEAAMWLRQFHDDNRQIFEKLLCSVDFRVTSKGRIVR
jgi:hypothetical protein